MSFVNQAVKRFLCASCKQLAHNAMMLDCSVEHHHKQFTLYCSKCTSANYQKCPLNQHLHPIFKPAIQQRQEMDELDINCPYALKQVIAKPHNDEDKEDEVFLYDTDYSRIASSNDDEGMNISNKNNQDDVDLSSSNEQQNGCEWIGKYKYLQHHLDHECKFIPINHQLLRIKTQCEQLQNDIIRSNAKRRSWIIGSILMNIIIILLFIVYIPGHEESMKDSDMECNYNGFDEEGIRKYIDNVINEKYEQIEWFQNILKGDLNAFKNEITETLNVKLNELDSMNTKEQNEGESKYAIIDDIVANAKTKYDGYKNQIDSIPFVQFVSNTVNMFKQDKLEQEL